MTRPLCPKCNTPLARCFCDMVVETTPSIEVIIWQHPSESGHAKGTVPLLARCLTNSKLIITETFSQSDFEQQFGATEGNLHLLFPEENEACSDERSESVTVPLRLLVLDGTWRKARKLLYLNPWLTTLPKYPLCNPEPSRYSIRKAEKPGQLSTLEATCAAIAQAENSTKNSQPILNAFERYLAKLSESRK
ncbi:tRNA-uridine aminocarboxypropyltransferase [Pseudomaricurvus sp.]|uniref:tRNA-uridine aminocarboxypropyltransferase n=1 Tax=Pseudomaricurvus sp. TaxID=2004510 RepID=UPI003F6A7E85